MYCQSINQTPCLDDKGRAAGNVVRIQGIVSGERLLGDALLGLGLVHRQQGVHRVLPPLRGRQRVLLTLPAQSIRVGDRSSLYRCSGTAINCTDPDPSINTQNKLRKNLDFIFFDFLMTFYL
jgi:hypothetical protein